MNEQPNYGWQQPEKSNAGAIVALILAALALIIMPKYGFSRYGYGYNGIVFDIFTCLITIALSVLALIKSTKNLKVQKDFAVSAMVISIINLAYMFISFMISLTMAFD